MSHYYEISYKNLENKYLEKANLMLKKAIHVNGRLSHSVVTTVNEHKN